MENSKIEQFLFYHSLDYILTAGCMLSVTLRCNLKGKLQVEFHVPIDMSTAEFFQR